MIEIPHPKHILTEHQIEPKKSLGQNFLFNGDILSKITAAAEISAEDEILEIGPGLGHLSVHLASQAKNLTAVELDQRFLPILEQNLASFSNVSIIHGDILKQNPTDWFHNNSYKVVANVPYYITGAILRHLLTQTIKPSLIVFTVQNEVARRLTAEPGKLSLLAVSAQLYGTVRYISSIKAGAFWPRPTIDSAIITIDLTTPPVENVDETLFFQIVKAGFSQKRKQLHKNLRQLNLSREQITAILQKSKVDGTRRAETLSIIEWASVTDHIGNLK